MWFVMSKRLFRAFTGPHRQSRKTPALTLRLEEFETRCLPSFSMVKDINTSDGTVNYGPLPYDAVMVGDTYYFSNIGSEAGRELWKSDGTPGGTVLVADINPGFASSSPDSLTALGNEIYFRVVAEQSEYQLWKSDGTAAGTKFVAELGQASSAYLIDHLMAAFGDKLLFPSKAGGNGEELWITDGTVAGTHEIKDLYPGTGNSYPREITVVGSQAYFVAMTASGTALWKTDGTEAGTVSLQSGSLPIDELTVVGDRLFFAVGKTAQSDTRSLWTTDGSPAGTVKLRDFGGKPDDSLNAFVNFKGSLYFSAYDTTYGYRIWTSNGTVNGTIPVLDFLPGNVEVKGNLLFAGDTKLFIASAETALTTTIRVSDGTQAGTTVVEANKPGGFFNRYDPFVVNGDSFYFSTQTTNSGPQFRRTDGTPTGTTLLQLNPAGNARLMNDIEFTSDGRIIFNAAVGSADYNLYISNPLLTNPSKLVDYRLVTADSNPSGLTRVGDVAFFFAENGSGLGLWASDGSTSGTHLIRVFHDSNFYTQYPPQVLGDQYTFIVWKYPNGGPAQSELWISDGSDAGTVLLKQLNLGFDYNHHNSPVVVGGELYFSAYEAGQASLWKTDGTAAGTSLVKTVAPSNWANEIGNLTNVDGRVFFSMNTGGANPTEELWVSDGTEAGTVRLKTFTGNGNIGEFANVNGILYYAGIDGVGTELWRSDGTKNGTYRVADLRTGAGSSSPSNLTNLNGTLYFTADSESLPNRELWKSDGTEPGTVKIVTLNHVVVPDYRIGKLPIAYLTPIGNKLYFKDENGFWELDGATDSIRLIHAIEEYLGGFVARLTTPFISPGNGTIYFRSVSGTDTGQGGSASYFYDTVTGTFGTWDTSYRTFQGGTSTGDPVHLGEQMLVPREEPVLGNELWSFNLPPNVRDDVYTVSPDTPLSTDGPGVLSNDHDMEGNVMQAVLVGGPAHGTLQLQADGSFVYTPEAGYIGLDQFTYRASDSNEESVIATVKLFIGIPAVPPTISAFADQTIFLNSQVVLPFTVGDDTTAPENLTITFESVNTGLFWSSASNLSGSSANRTLTLSAGAGSGFTTILVTVKDEYGLTAQTTFNVSVQPISNPPSPPPLDIFDPFAASSGRDVSLYKSDGTLKSSVTPFPNQPGTVRVASGDFNGDGVLDYVFGTGPGGPSQVKVFDGKTMTMLFLLNPFEASFTGGVNVAAGDVNGDGKAEIVVSPDEGGGPRVRVFNGGDLTPIADFFGIDDPNFRGGARVAIGDMNGDGKGDLLVVAGYGGGPRVAGFDGSQLTSKGGPKLFNDFFAFEKTLRNGIHVAAGDVNGDGYADLVAGGGPGGGPRVYILDGKSLATEGSQSPVALGNFFAGDPSLRGGVRVAVKNLDWDDKADIVTGAGPGSISSVGAYYGKYISLIGTPPISFTFEAFPGQASGVFVG
jgi:ELWxxDGT repeat protein